MTDLVDDDTRAASSVVANCAMNRERQLAGVNSYARELGFHPVDVLTRALSAGPSAAWLDLCCGTGRALIQAAGAAAAGWLTPTGRLVADLDLASIRRPDGRPVGRPLAAALRAAGFDYDTRRRRISRTGRLDVRLPYVYLGASDRAGPNYTGQPAVHAYYDVPSGGSWT